ncbi:hypothetical protein RSAG8_03218, partial [Rhizoctonia solani AG-8 WAC10335]
MAELRSRDDMLLIAKFMVGVLACSNDERRRIEHMHRTRHGRHSIAFASPQLTT